MLKQVNEPSDNCQTATSIQSLRFYPLTFVNNKDDITVGRPDIGTYAAFPSSAVALLQQLQAGLASNVADEWYYQRYNEEIDIGDFIGTLQELGFVRGDDEEENVLVYSIPCFLRWLSYAAFSPVAWVLYSALFVYSMYQMYYVPRLIPAYNNLFFSPSFFFVEFGLLIGQILGTLFHEFYHSLAGKRLGLSSRLDIGYRLGYIVLETDLTGLWSVPRRARYLPLLAGMLSDVILFSLLTSIAGLLIHSTGFLAFVGSYCVALAFSTFLRFIWQFNFYLQTDLYYVIANTMECNDLQNTTRNYLYNSLFRFIGRFDKMKDEMLWHPRDRQMAPRYIYCFLGGYGLTIGMYLFVGFPILCRVFYGVCTHLFSGQLSGYFWDSCVILLLNIFQIIVWVSIFVRNRKQKKGKISKCLS